MKVFLTLVIFNIPVIIGILSDMYILHRRFPYLSSVIMFVVNLIIVIISVFEISFINNEYNIIYIDNFNTTIFIRLCICAIVLFIIFFILIWNRRRTRLLKKEDIDKRYINFTKQAKEGGTIKCFTRNLSFLGEIIKPEKCIYNKSDSSNYYKRIMFSRDDKICNESNRGCKNIDGSSCAMACGQFIQLLKMKNNMEKLEILCVESEYSKALLGKLVYTFQDKCKIHLYDENIRNGIYMFARIITTDGPSPMIWHWKVGNKFSETQKYHRSDGNSLNEMNVLGDTLFYLIDTLLWNNSHMKKADEIGLRNEWLKAFYDVIDINENEREWEK